MNRRHRYEYMRAIIVGAQTNSGLLSGTMTHDECYDFLRMGRNLERADMTTRIIDVRSASLLPEVNDELTPFGNLEWMSVLKSLTAYQMYRREMRLRISRPDVLKFLLQHDKFPLSHTLLEVESCLNSLPRNEKPLALTTKLRNQLKRAKPQTLKQEKLHEFIDKTQLGLIKIHNEIDKTYF